MSDFDRRAPADDLRALGDLQGPDRPLLHLFPSRLAEEPLEPVADLDEKPSLAELLDIGDQSRSSARLRSFEDTSFDSPNGMTPSYGTFYALWEHPFAAVPDPRFLFHSAAYDRAEQQLVAAIDRRDGLVVLTGESGVGKTMLCRGALSRIDRRTFTALVDKASVSMESLLKMLLIDFGVISSVDLGSERLAQSTRADLTTALREFLRTLAPLNARAVVLIDDADQLSDDTLAEVCALAEVGTDVRLLQVVLVGRPDLLIALGRRDPAQKPSRLSSRVTFDRLEREDIGGYLAHRLAVASDGRSRVEFDTHARSLIYELSDGLPGSLNQLADRALAHGFDLSSSLIDSGIVEAAARDVGMLAPQTPATRLARRAAVVAALVAFLLLGAATGLFVFRDQVRRAFAGSSAGPPPPPTVPAPAAVPLEPARPDANASGAPGASRAGGRR